jgi:hypothetical protein
MGSRNVNVAAPNVSVFDPRPGGFAIKPLFH